MNLTHDLKEDLKKQALKHLLFEELLEKITGPESSDSFAEKEPYDVLVVGGGPAGASASLNHGMTNVRVENGHCI
mgnify:CR=1 FL=1